MQQQQQVYIPDEIWKGTIRDFKIDLERKDMLPKVRQYFKDKIEFSLLYTIFEEHYHYIYHLLSTIREYECSAYYHGVDVSMITCIRDICEYIDENYDMLEKIHQHENCPQMTKEFVIMLLNYYD